MCKTIKLATIAILCVAIVGVSLSIYYGVNIGIPSSLLPNNEDTETSTGGNEDTETNTGSGYAEESGYESVECEKTNIVSNGNGQLPIYQSITKEEGIIYGQGATDNGNIDLKMDIYHPGSSFLNRNYQKYPLMIHIHGGSFTGGSKSDGYMKSLSEFWAHRGFVVASIDYRLMGNSPIVSNNMKPVLDYVTLNLSDVLKNEAQAKAAVCAVEDTLTAYDYLKNLNFVDLDKVVLNGYSAGAITALWAAYGVDNFAIDRPPIKAVLSHWGMLVTEKDQMKALVDQPYEPPVFLIHATGDGTVPYDGTQLLADRMHNLKFPYALHCQESGTHAIDIAATIHTGSMTILNAEVLFLANILI